MSTTRQEVGLITGDPSSVWEFNQIHGVSYCVILKMAVNKKDQCCMGIQVNSRRQLYSLEFSIKYTLPYIYFNCFCLLCGYFPDPLLITFSALESEWNFHTTLPQKLEIFQVFYNMIARTLFKNSTWNRLMIFFHDILLWNCLRIKFQRINYKKTEDFVDCQ